MTTRSPKLKDMWVSRVDLHTVALVIGIRNRKITFVGEDGVKRTWDESEFVCFWKPQSNKL